MFMLCLWLPVENNGSGSSRISHVADNPVLSILSKNLMKLKEICPEGRDPARIHQRKGIKSIAGILLVP